MAVFLQVFLQSLPNKRNVIRTNTRFFSGFVCRKIQLFRGLFLSFQGVDHPGAGQVRVRGRVVSGLGECRGLAEAVEDADATIVKAKIQMSHLEMFYF